MSVLPQNVERLLSYQEAGKLLGVTDRTIWTLVDQGQLPNVRFRRSVRIDPADLRTFINQSKQPSTSGPGSGPQNPRNGGGK